MNNLATSPVTLFHVGLTFVLAICSLLRYCLKYILSACNGHNKLPKQRMNVSFKYTLNLISCTMIICFAAVLKLRKQFIFLKKTKAPGKEIFLGQFPRYLFFRAVYLEYFIASGILQPIQCQNRSVYCGGDPKLPDVLYTHFLCRL